MGRRPVTAARREQILEGLFEAMARSGTRGASISDIAEAAGIARGALHYYFTSKDEIREALMRRLGDGYLAGLDRYLDRTREQSPLDLHAMVRALVRYHFAGDRERTARLLAVWIDYWGQSTTDPALNRLVLDVQERARQACAKALLGARPDLAHASENELRHLAATLLAMVEGALLQWRVAAHAAIPLDADKLAARLTEAALALCSSVDLRPASPAQARIDMAAA